MSEDGDAARGTDAVGASAPLLRVVRGEPTAEELAALTAVLAVRGSGEPVEEPAPVGLWGSRESLLRRPLPSGPGAWGATYLPR